MKYELDELERLTRELIAAKEEDHQGVFRSWEAEAAGLLKVLKGGVLALDAGKINFYIRWHQEGLVELSDMVNQHYKGTALPVLLAVLEQIDALAERLVRSFPEQISADVKLADWRWEREKTVVWQRALALQKRVKTLKTAEDLASLIGMPVLSWLDARTAMVPVGHQYAYLVRYLDSWEILLDDKHLQRISEERLLYHLVELNLNHWRCLQLWVKRLEGRLKHAPDKNVLFLEKVKQRLSDTLTVSGSYQEQVPPLKSQLLAWIDEELYMYEQPETVSHKREAGGLIRINLPVGAIVLLHKLLHRYDFFEEKNQSKLIRLAVANFCSVETDKISLNSYGSKYRAKQPTDTAARTLRKFLRQLLDDLDDLLS